MHEWALAEAVAVAAAEVAEQEGIASAHSLEVHVGELQQIDLEAFEFGLRLICQETERLTEVVPRLVIDPARLACRRCGHQWLLADSLTALSEDEREAVHFLPEAAHAYLGCPACSSPDFETVAGRGVSIAGISA